MNTTATASPAGSRRFWITILVFALVNAALWAGWFAVHRPTRMDVLRVEDFSPGDKATIGQRPTLTWRFNLDVDSGDRIEPPGAVTPAIAGKWIWAGARTLSFVAEEELPPATRFTFRLSPKHIRTPEGFHLAKMHEATVNTLPLQVRTVSQAGMEEEDRFVLAVEFNDRVLPADVLAKLKLTDAEGKPVECTLHGEAAGEVVRVLTASIPMGPGGRTVTVRLPEGLAGTSGPLGLAHPFEQQVSLDSALAATELDAEALSRGTSHIWIRFNRRCEVEAIKEVLSVEPPVPFRMAEDWRGIQLKGDFVPETRYLVRIAKAPTGADSSRYPRPDVLSILIPNRRGDTWFDHTTGYLSSHGNRTLLAHAVNSGDLRLNVWRVYDNNIVAWRNAPENHSWNDPAGYGRPIATRIIPATAKKNEVQDIRIELDDLLPADARADGVYRVQIEAMNPDAGNDDGHWYEKINRSDAVVTLSDIGLTAKHGRDGITVWAVSLKEARPLPNVRVRAYSSKNQLLGQAMTGPDGLARIGGIDLAKEETAAVILADAPERAVRPPSLLQRWMGTATTRPAAPQPSALTWLDLRNSTWNMGDADLGGRPYLREGHEAFLFTERGVYRPGETVRLRAIVRGMEAATPASPFPVKWQIRRPDLRDYRSHTVMLDADGGAGFDLPLPEDLPTGRWTALLGLPGGEVYGTITFSVEDYMPDRIKVEMKVGEGDRFAVGDNPLAVHVHADYLFGRPAAGLRGRVTARLDPLPFRPDNWNGWTFGDEGKLIDMPGVSATGTIAATPADGGGENTGQLKLNDDGKGTWNIDLSELADETKPAAMRFTGPWRLAAVAEVYEAGGRAVTAAESISIDALPHYIGVRPASAATPAPGVETRVDVVLVKPSGELNSTDASVEVSLLRETWNTTLVTKEGRYHYQSTRVLDAVKDVPQTVDVRSGRGELSMTIGSSGAYVMRLREPRTGAITSQRFYVTDGRPWDDNISRDNPEKLEIALLSMPDGGVPTTLPTTMPAGAVARFAPGGKAMALVRSPFPGRLLLTIETDRALHTQVIDMPESQLAVPIEVSDVCRPNAYVTATVLRGIEPDAKWRTHRAFGAARLTVDPAEHKLDLAIMCPTDIRPRQQLSVSVRVGDSRKAPVAGTAVVLMAVDEGILQLTGFVTPDPLAYFNGKRALAVGSADIYSELMPEVARPEKVSRVGGDGDDMGRHRSPITAKRVKPVALVSPVLHADADGLVQHEFDVPEFTGSLRIMAIAYAGNHFGSAEKPVLVRSPLLVQSSFPRFAAPGDTFEAPLVVFNNATSDSEVKIAAELLDTGDVLEFIGGGRSVQLAPVMLAAGAQHRMVFNVRAKEACGVAKIRLSATMGGEAFEENIELPIRPASPIITRGGYLAASPGQPLEIEVPGGFIPGTESLDIKLTPWPVLELPSGLDYLERYPYGCAEQTISKCIPLAYLADIGQRIGPGVFDAQRVSEKVQSGIIRLMGMQCADGGIAMWPGSRESWPWASVYAAHFLVEAEKAGHAVPEGFRTSLLQYAMRLLEKDAGDADRLETQAYACYVMAIAGTPPRSVMSRLQEVADGPATSSLPVAAPQRGQAKLMLSLAWLAAGRKDLAASMLPATLPQPRKARQLGGNVGSPVRDRALAVSTMLAVSPDHPALPAAVQQLADSIKGKRWLSTQDAAFSVMAIGRYLRDSKPAVAYASAELWLGENRLLGAEAGKTLEYRTAGARPAGKYTLRLAGAPDAKGYITWLQSGIPVAPPVDEDNGLKVRRWYLNEQGQPLAGTTISSGDLIRVAITIDGPAAEHIVIEDLLPAGLEVENPRLNSAAAHDQPTERGSKPQPFFDVQRLDIRDDRVIVVGNMPHAGSGRFEYLARAVTPGVFIIPPLRAECMYDMGMMSLSGGGGKLTVTGPGKPEKP